MARHLLLPVGTNPLPVYVSARILLENERYASIRFLHSGDQPGQGTFETARNIETALKPYLQGATTAFTVIADPGNPLRVEEAARTALKAIATERGEGDTSIHFHYSGGTKTMVLFGWTTTKIECDRRGWACEASYLDPRQEGGGLLINSSGLVIDGDARQRISHRAAEAYLTTLLDLHSMRPKAPVRMSGQFSPLGEALWNSILSSLDRNLLSFQDWRRAKNGWNRGKSVLGRPIDLSPACLDSAVLSLIASLPGANLAESVLTLKVGSERSLGTLSRAFGCSGGGFLEEAADVALTDALRKRQGSTGRANWFVAPEMKFAPVGLGQREAPEVDLVGVLSYQVLAVSCTTDGDRKMTKQKAFEVLQRARQFGGDEARVIVLSGTDRNTADSVEADVHDDIGSNTPPVRIWGRDRWRNLAEHFENYLERERNW